jgi:hypothetical protein
MLRPNIRRLGARFRIDQCGKARGFERAFSRNPEHFVSISAKSIVPYRQCSQTEFCVQKIWNEHCGYGDLC